ncbi:Cullin-3, variant 2 [Puccinia graminis f. sp. tritici]|uniref:Cullin-3, variant 2 n=1 Tax=Puccinia graminis f. sp. tritici TaxID=56615 RepID=A0A5B0S1N9_PUCGR|nr:Cullin-3, variant 2 [Puccinia graminis f. sp. tritici]
MMSSSNKRNLPHQTIQHNTTNRSSKVKPTKRHGEPAIDTWSRLSKAITEILNHNASKLSFEEHYRYAYNMVLYKQGTKLFVGVRDLVAHHLDEQATRQIEPNFPSRTNPTTNLLSQTLPTTTTTTTTGKGKEKAVDDSDLSPPSSSSNQTAHQLPLVNGSASERLSVIQSQERFLKSVREVWDDHVACMKKLRDVLKYMDKVYTTTPGNGYDSMPTVWDLGLYIFLTHIIRSPKYPISSLLISGIITLITSDRLGDTINSSVIRSATEMLTDLSNHSPEIIKRIDDQNGGNGGGEVGQSIYKTDFEPVFLLHSREFYREEGNRLLSNDNAAQYLLKVEKRLIEEDIRSQSYLHETTEKKLTQILNEELIKSHVQDILHHPSCGLKELIHNDCRSDLKRLYQLFCRLDVDNGLQLLKEGIRDWIKERGQQINDGTAPPALFSQAGGGPATSANPSTETASTGAAPGNSAALQWVTNVIQLRDKFIGLLNDSFDSHILLQTCIDEGFSGFINSNKRSAEFISLFIDDKLKKGLKGKTEEEIEEQLDKTIALYRHLNEKDMFEKYYKNHLAKRLLFGKSVSEDTERNMLSKLKIESGSAFTRDSEGMLKDLKMSNEMAKLFKDWCQKNHPGIQLDLSVTVGSSSMWPMSQANQMNYHPSTGGSSSSGTPGNRSACIIPKVLEDAIKVYERFYATRHSGRRLNWHTELGNMEIKIRFKKSTHELSVSTFAGIVLLLFDGQDENRKLSYEEIKTATMITDMELKRTLQSLACAKYKILTKEPRSKEINEKLDTFRFNDGFTNPMSRIKIQTVTNKVENRLELKETSDRVEEDRRLHTEACIVRVMKTRQRLAYVELNVEVVSQLSRRFKPTPVVIKTSIEKLIEKEYLMRDPQDRKIIIYLVRLLLLVLSTDNTFSSFPFFFRVLVLVLISVY